MSRRQPPRGGVHRRQDPRPHRRPRSLRRVDGQRGRGNQHQAVLGLIGIQNLQGAHNQEKVAARHLDRAGQGQDPRRQPHRNVKLTDQFYQNPLTSSHPIMTTASRRKEYNPDLKHHHVRVKAPEKPLQFRQVQMTKYQALNHQTLN